MRHVAEIDWSCLPLSQGEEKDVGRCRVLAFLVHLLLTEIDTME